MITIPRKATILRIKSIGFLLALTSAWAQNPLWLDLRGEWRNTSGDDPAFAQSGFDDSGWDRLTLPTKTMPPVGHSWLRRQIDLPEGTDTSQLAITLGILADVCEVYVNGTKIGSAGAARRMARPHTFPVPAGLVIGERPVTIALRLDQRFGSPPFPRQLRAVADEGPYLLTYMENAPSDVAAKVMLKRERLVALSFATCSLELLLALVLLFAWFTDHEQKQLLILVAFLLLEMASRLYESLTVILDASHSRNVNMSLVGLGATLLAWFALRLLDYRRKSPYAVVGVMPILMVVVHILNGVPTLVSQLLNVGVILLCAHSIWRTWWRDGWLSSEVLLAGSTAATAFLHTQRVGYFRFLPLYRQVGGYVFHLYDTLIVILATIMSLILMRKLGLDRQEKQRLEAELGAARVVQQLLLVQPAGTEHCSVEAVYEPAQEVGGDFYWTRADADGALLVMVGDVSGKGLKAAMMVTMIIGALQKRSERKPGEILSLLNEAITRDSQQGFVTACCLRVEPDGTVVAANAGHIAPYFQGREVQVEAGLPLGVLNGVTYEEALMQLSAGEFLTFVSDGVVEAENARRELFGFDRTREISCKPAQEIAEAAKAWGQTDDITVVTVKRYT